MFLGHLLAFPFSHIACSQILLHLPKYKIKKKQIHCQNISVGVKGQGVHIYVYVGLRAQSKDSN